MSPCWYTSSRAGDCSCSCIPAVCCWYSVARDDGGDATCCSRRFPVNSRQQHARACSCRRRAARGFSAFYTPQQQHPPHRRSAYSSSSLYTCSGSCCPIILAWTCIQDSTEGDGAGDPGIYTSAKCHCVCAEGQKQKSSWGLWVQ